MIKTKVSDGTTNKYGNIKHKLFNDFKWKVITEYCSSQEKLDNCEFMESPDYPFRVKFHGKVESDDNAIWVEVISLDLGIKNSEELLYTNVLCEEWLTTNVYDK